MRPLQNLPERVLRLHQGDYRKTAGRKARDSGKGQEGVPKPDPALREDERIPFAEDIGDYFQREIQPHLPDGWMDRKKDKLGYEINFNRYFYRHTPLRSPQEIADEMRALESQNEGLLREMFELVTDSWAGYGDSG